MLIAARLSEAVRAVCPIVGVSVGKVGDASTVRIDGDNATPEQLAAAQSVVNAFDWSAEAHAAWLLSKQPERNTLKESASQAIADNAAFLADSSVTQAEAVAQVKALTRQVNRIIALLAKD